jgi:hypothetical protein
MEQQPVFVKNTKRYVRQKDIVLMCLRCGYIVNPGGRLTKKGRGFLYPWQWRLLNKIKCRFSKSWERDMFGFLRGLEAEQIIRDAMKTNA